MLRMRILAVTAFCVGSQMAMATTVTTVRTPDQGIQPQAAVDLKSTVHLIYMKGEPRGGDIFYVYRRPGKSSFSAPIRVNTQPQTAMGMGTVRGAQIGIGKNGRVHVVWNGMGDGVRKPDVPDGGHAQDALQADDPSPLFYARLNDEGTAFEPERNVIACAYGLDGGSSVAADSTGNVYVTWHGSPAGNTNDEAGRAIFVARSTDEGRTFEREHRAVSESLGACACCGMRAFADSKGHLFALYRDAHQFTNRDEILLMSRDRGVTFEVAYSHHWNISTCPMSSATISECFGRILAAAETHGRVYFFQLDMQSGHVSSPISPDASAKYPVVVGNSRGETLLVWAEGTGWNRPGSIAWQVFPSPHFLDPRYLSFFHC